MSGAAVDAVVEDLTAEPRKIKVFIVDDHAVVREGLTALLSRDVDMHIVGTADGAEEALRLLPLLDPDVAIIDVRLPSMSGLELAREIAERRLRAEIVILSAYVDADMVYAALLAGARAYVVKDMQAEQLKSAVRAAARGETSLDPKVAGGIVQWAARLRPGAAPTLRAAERSALSYASRGLSTAQIAASMNVSPHTVKFYLQQAYERLGVRTRSEAIAMAVRQNLL
jgi:DNA-binding NarL/FixJ family response regulator